MSGSEHRCCRSDGEVELWNEPPWEGDPWDNILDYCDNSPSPISPGPQSQYLSDRGFVAALQNVAPINGVIYIWAGTEKSDTNSVRILSRSAILASPSPNRRPL
jgi:hypothetical protein